MQPAAIASTDINDPESPKPAHSGQTSVVVEEPSGVFIESTVVSGLYKQVDNIWYANTAYSFDVSVTVNNTGEALDSVIVSLESNVGIDTRMGGRGSVGLILHEQAVLHHHHHAAGPGGSSVPATKSESKTSESPSADDRTPQQRLADARAQLDRLIGLDAIKDHAVDAIYGFCRSIAPKA